MTFVSRFALNGSSRHATIMAMGISIKTAEPSRAHCGRCGASDRFGEPTIEKRATTSAYRKFNNAKIQNRDNRSFVSCMSTSYGKACHAHARLEGHVQAPCHIRTTNEPEKRLIP